MASVGPAAPGRGLILIVGVVAAISGLALADRYLGDRAPWRSGGHGIARRSRPWRAGMPIWTRGGSGTRSGRFRDPGGERVRGRGPDDPRAGRGRPRGGRRGAARPRARLELQPNAAAARVLAAIYLSANENERGLQMLLNASRIDPEDFRPWYAMGELVYLRLRRYEPAIDAFQEALERQPRPPGIPHRPASRPWSSRIAPRTPNRS